MKNLFLNVFADSARFDPLKNFNFVANFSWKNGNTYMSSNFGFNKISGLKAGVEVITYREGGDNISDRKLAGKVSFDPITMEKGMTDNKEMWDAFKVMFDIDDAEGNATAASSSDGDSYRGTLVIEIQNRKKQTIRTYKLRNAWMSDYSTGDLDAEGNAIILESITIQHEGFILED